jgi:hypothetical protein
MLFKKTINLSRQLCLICCEDLYPTPALPLERGGSRKAPFTRGLGVKISAEVQELRTRSPGVGVIDLVLVETVDFDAHCFEFHPRDFFIHCNRDRVNTSGEFTFVLD